MKLNIYGKQDGKRTVLKTYEAESYNLTFGTVSDVAKALDLDSITTGSNAEIIKMAINLIIHSLDTVTWLFLDIFDGLTEEELRGATVPEMAEVVVDVVRYTIKVLGIDAPKN